MALVELVSAHQKRTPAVQSRGQLRNIFAEFVQFDVVQLEDIVQGVIVVDRAFVEGVAFAKRHLDVEPAACDAFRFDVEHRHFTGLVDGKGVGILQFQIGDLVAFGHDGIDQGHQQALVFKTAEQFLEREIDAGSDLVHEVILGVLIAISNSQFEIESSKLISNLIKYH